MNKILKVTVSLIIICNLSLAEDKNVKHEVRQEFMDLYFDFTGNTDESYPENKENASSSLGDITTSSTEGDLIIVAGSDLYIFDNMGQKKLSYTIRADPESGFYEMTAISHIGPALAYLTQVKESGESEWENQLLTILENIKAVKDVNNETNNHWLETVNSLAWQPHKNEIKDMIDYSCNQIADYLERILSKEIDFNMTTLNDELLDGNDNYPIPFNNVMVGTFMLTALTEIYDIYKDVGKIHVEWENARFLIKLVAGTNLSGGVSKDSNWLYEVFMAISDNKIDENKVFFVPSMEIRETLNLDKLNEKDLSYYSNTVWGKIYQRTQTSKKVFTNINDIKFQFRDPIPGDYSFTDANNIDDFLERLKYSLAQPTEMLSNTVGFWIGNELADKDWDIKKIDIPGFTTGFPDGYSSYKNTN